MGRRRFPRWMTLGLIAATMSVLTVGIWFYHDQQQNLRNQVDKGLLGIAQLKVNQLSSWRQERMSEGAELAERQFLPRRIKEWLADKTPAGKEDLLASFRTFQRFKGFVDVMLIEPGGRVLLSLNGDESLLDDFPRAALDAAMRDGKPVFVDLHSDRTNLGRHTTVIAPLIDKDSQSNRPLGAIAMVYDAKQFLYPLIHAWPVPSRTAETLLVRRDGENVLFLNDLRHISSAGLSLRIPLTRTDVPAVMAVLGKQGVVEGRDYRGEKVISAIMPVPNSPWFIVAKIDSAEAFAEWRTRSVLILALLAGTMGLTTTVWLVAWQWNQRNHFRSLYQAKARHQVTLRSIGDAVIVADVQGRVELMNPVTEALTGWTDREARGKQLEEIFHIIDETTGQPVTSPVKQVLRDGVVVGLASHTLLLSRDGRRTPIAEIAAPIFGEQGAIQSVVLVFRDQTGEREAMKVLNASEARYRRLFEAARDGILILDADSGRIIDVNPYLVEMLGYLREDFLGKELWEIGAFQDIAASREAFLKLQKENYIRYENLPLQTRQGGRFDVEFVSNVYLVNDKQVIQCNIRNITERKQAEQSLRESEERFQRALENIPDVITIYDNDLKIRYINSATTRVTGRPVADFVGKRDDEVWPPEVCSAYLPTLKEAFRAGKTCSVDAELHLPTGARMLSTTYVPLTDEAGKVREVLGVTHDFTEHRLAEAFNKAVLDNLPTGIAVNSVDPTVTFSYMNDNFPKFYRTTRERLAGPDAFWSAVFEDPKFQANIRKRVLDDCASGDTDRMHWENVPITRDGEGTYFVNARNIPVPGKPLMISLVWDVTEHKQVEEEKERLQMQLFQAQKMEAVGQLAAGVAHDFRNQLTVIKGYSEMLIREESLADQPREYLEQILQAANHSTLISEQLLAFGRQQMLQPKVVKLDELIRNIYRTLPSMIGEDVELSIGSQPDVGNVNVDPTQFRQAMLNLALNARDAMPSGGRLIIETQNTELDDSYRFQHVYAKPGSYVMVTVTDTGVGMDAQTVQKLFEPFHTTKPAGQGTGLGLAMVYGFVKQSGGHIVVYSEPGQGTTFKMYFPRVHGEPESAETAHWQKPLVRGTGTILVTEDEDSIRKLLVITLKGSGYTVLEASNAAEAIEISQHHDGPIQLLITDVVMPGMDGHRLAEHLVAHRKDLDVLYVSGYAGRPLVDRGVLAAGAKLLTKPFSASDLCSAVHEIFANRTDKS